MARNSRQHSRIIRFRWSGAFSINAARNHRVVKLMESPLAGNATRAIDPSRSRRLPTTMETMEKPRRRMENVLPSLYPRNETYDRPCLKFRKKVCVNRLEHVVSRLKVWFVRFFCPNKDYFFFFFLVKVFADLNVLTKWIRYIERD